MDEIMLERLSEIMYKKIISDKNISDDQMNEYLLLIFEYIHHNNIIELPHSFRLLRETLFKKWEYGLMKNLTSETAFMLGALWSGAMLSELAEKEVEYKPKIHVLAQQNMSHFNSFEAIYKNPGIKHKVLAEYSNMSTSELSQWMGKIQQENYFSFSRVGREKYYYIEKRGEEIFQEMIRQRKVTRTCHNHSENIFGYGKICKMKISKENCNKQKKVYEKFDSKEVLIVENKVAFMTLEEGEKKWNSKQTILNKAEKKCQIC